MPPVVLVVVPVPLVPEPAEPAEPEPLVPVPLVPVPVPLVPVPAPGTGTTPPAVLPGVVDEGPPIAVPDDEDASDPEVGIATDDEVAGATEAAWPGLAVDPLHPTALAASTAMMRWMDPRALMQTPPRISRAFPSLTSARFYHVGVTLDSACAESGRDRPAQAAWLVD
jgi:hypothetical protein